MGAAAGLISASHLASRIEPRTGGVLCFQGMIPDMTVPPPLPHLKPGVAALVRRGWLKVVAAGLALSTLGLAAWQFKRQGTPAAAPSSAPIDEAAMVTRLVDLLVPRDDTPGAVDLGVHMAVQQAMLKDADLAQAVRQLLDDLERDAQARHRAAFLALQPAEQSQLLLALSQATLSRAGGRGFVMLRHHTMNLYYAHPQSWPALAIDGPPQPRGHLDYTSAPRRRV